MPTSSALAFVSTSANQPYRYGRQLQSVTLYGTRHGLPASTPYLQGLRPGIVARRWPHESRELPTLSVQCDNSWNQSSCPLASSSTNKPSRPSAGAGGLPNSISSARRYVTTSGPTATSMSWGRSPMIADRHSSRCSKWKQNWSSLFGRKVDLLERRSVERSD